MQETDVDRVTEIECDLFTLPWPRPSFLFEAGDNRQAFAIVGLEDGAVVGYAVAWFLREELHIGNIAVARDRQGGGRGKLLLESLLKEASDRQMRYATLEVRVSNARAINLYRRYGFKGVAIRRRYYSDTGEDALVMFAELDANADREEP